VRIKKYRKDNSVYKFLIFAVPLSLIIVLFLSFVIVSTVLGIEYRDWEKRFENSHLAQDFLFFDKGSSYKDLIDKKVDKFSSSNKSTDYVEIGDMEFLYLVGKSLENVLPNGIEIEKGWVSSEVGDWSIYIKTKTYFVNLWYIINLSKDNVEGNDVYI